MFLLILLLSKNFQKTLILLIKSGNISSLKKRRNLERILALFNNYSTLDNATIRRLLDFDDRTVVRYMDELERMDKVTQVGETGRKTFYKLKD